MLGDDFAEVHPVELVTAEDEYVFVLVGAEVEEVFADGVCGALVPGVAGEGLFCGKYFDKAIGKVVKFVGLGDMAMEGCGVKLGEKVDFAHARVDTVRDGNVN